MKKIIFYSALCIVFQSSCKKEFDLPPIKPAESLDKINIAGIKAKYKADLNYQFKSDSSLYCVITADEVSGNLFKDVYVKDATGALHVRLVNSGGLFIGDSIRIDLKGVILNENNSLIQLDSVDSEKSIVKLASGYDPKPEALTISQIVANPSATNSVQSRLVKLNNVEFVAADQNQTFADVTGKTTLNRVLRSCAGQTLAVRTSGYCSFAGKLTPNRNGSITGIISQYGTIMQLILRNYDEVMMSNPLCSVTTPTNLTAVYLNKDFNDNSISSGGWSTHSVTNSSVSWTIGTYSSSSTPFAKISGYSSGANAASENWLISPTLNLSTATDPTLSFQTAAKFSGPALDVLISTNYSGGAPSTATWTSLAPAYILSSVSGNYIWTPSGNIPLSAFKSAAVHVAFKYSSTMSGATTYELDDIIVKEN